MRGINAETSVAKNRNSSKLFVRMRAAAALFSAASLLTSGVAHAEGSRTLYPLGSLSTDAGGTPNASRSLLYYGTQTYIGIVRQQNFFYVYAEAGEYILLGTSGARNALRLFPPQNFGTPGLESPTTAPLNGSQVTLSGTDCTLGTANIANRTAELAGPNSADGSATVPSGYAPCYYQVTTTGVHGVFFGTATNTNMWDVTVRSSANSLTDINGRLFTYSLAANTNAAGNRTYATHYYVTNDGYRYSQTMRGLAPFAYVLYSNPKGFMDFRGNPLYKNVRAQGSPVLDDFANGSFFRPANTGIQAQEPTYPMFFSNVVAGGVDTATGLQATLNALGIPLAPQHPVALSASFEHAHTGGSTTYVGQGGVFTISTQNALTYQIVLKGGNTPAHDDPAHADNRVLTGDATGLNQQVYWDGLTNAGIPMPAGSGYTFEATGRAGEVHFPFLDAEANLSGGPTVTRLNGAGAPNSIVYYDDRGYTTNGIDVGTPGGHLCGTTAGASNEQPDPLYSLTGVDSSNGNLNGTGRYYRSWGSTHTGNTGNDCALNGYFGDAKGMDMWALIRSAPPAGTLSLDILNVADVTATASIPESVAPGGTGTVVAKFGNVGSQAATNTVYTVQLPSNLAGVSCSGATCSYDSATGLVTITGLPTALSPGQWTNNVMLQYTAPASGNVPVTVTITTASAQPTAPAPQAPDTASGTTQVAAGGTIADVLAQLDAPLTVAPNGVVNVAVTFRNLGPLTAANVGYALTLPSGLTGVSCSTPATCNYNAGTGAITVSGLPVSLNAAQSTAFTLTYTAPGAGVVSTTATVTTTTAENDAANNATSALTTVSTSPFADVTTSVAPPAQAVGATTVNVPVTFRNLGPLPAAGMSYTVTLSNGLSGVTCSAPVTCSYNSGTGALTLTAGAPATLQTGQILSFTVSYTAPPTGTVSFATTVSTTTGDSNTNNNSAAAQTAIIPNTHTVTFNSNGGSAVSDLTNVTHGSTITAPTPPTRTGYTFNGWHKNVGLSDPWNFASDTVTGATTLYAAWQLNTYTLTYTAGPNGSITGTSPQMVSHGSNGTAVTAVASPGYHFVSWSDGVTTASRTALNVTSNLSVSASFAINSYTLTYTAGPNGSITGTSPQSVNHGSNGTTVTAVPNPGYHFVNWSDGVTTASRTALNVTGDLTVSANFAINQYTLTYTAGPNGSITGTSPQNVNHGSNGTMVTAVASPGYHFVSWSDGVTTASRTALNVTSDLTVSASFAINQYTLTYTAGANGSITGTSPQSVNHGSNGTAVTAVANPGYHFVSWSDGVTTASRTALNVTSNLTVSASFAINSYTLTYTAGANGSITGTSPQAVSHGSNGSAVTAVPATGYHFVSWSDGVTTASRTDLNVTSNLSVSANFAINSYTLTYTAGANGLITGTSPQSVNHGGNGSAVTAVPDLGYHFVLWSDGVTTASRTDLNVANDIAVAASFAINAAPPEEHTLALGDQHSFNTPASSTLSRLRRTRGGDQTDLTNPGPAEYAGMIECNGNACRFIARRSGWYELTFINGNGDAYVVVFIVHPNIGFATERQAGRQGTRVHVRVVLDDLPIEAELRVNYSVQNGAPVGAPQPADLLTRNPQQLLFDVGNGGNVTCFEAGHCHKEFAFTPTASSGEVGFLLHPSAGVNIGRYETHRVELLSAALVPLSADLVLFPGHTVIAGTAATAGVIGLPAGNYSFDWSGSDSTIGIGAETSDVATPGTTTVGNYLIRVTVRDLDHPNRAPITLESWLRVIAAGQSNPVCGGQGCDDDGTRIPAAHQTPACGLGMNDPANAIPYRLQIGVKGWTWDSAGLCLETLPGYGLRLGMISFLSAPQYGAGIESSAIRSFGNSGRQALNAIDYAYEHVGIYYDFEVSGLDTAGQSVAVVVPLPRNLTIPAQAVWRKYRVAGGWSNFVVDANNALHSARRIADQCPSPVSGIWDDNPGLVAGLHCVRLTIQDGGVNDMDRQANGVIVDPGTLGVRAGGHKITSSGKSGGGAMTPLMLLAAGGLMLFRWRRARRWLALAALAMAASSASAAEDFRTPGWFVGGTAGIAMGEVSKDDVTRGLFAHDINATARVEDRNRFAWSAFGGYRIADYLSLQAGYTHLGVVTTYVDGNAVDLNDIPDVLPASGAGWELSAAGYLPLGERVDVYARIGAWRWETLYHVHETGQKQRPKASGMDALGGVGVRYWLTHRWQAGLGWDRYRVDDQNVNLLGLSVIYQLGSRRRASAAPEPEFEPLPPALSPEPPTPAAEPLPAPPPVAAAEPTPPAPVEPAAPIPPLKFRVHFGFDSAAINAGAASIIDQATAYLAANPEHQVEVTGHTDLLGGNDYNLRLSLRRAQAVADALTARGIGKERIAVSARGLHAPLAGELSEHARATDRRVEIVPVPPAAE